MSEMTIAAVAIEGTRVLLWNAFNPGVILVEKKIKHGAAGNDPQEWKRTVLATEEGQLYVTNFYIFGCLRETARYTKQGRYRATCVLGHLRMRNPAIRGRNVLPSRHPARLAAAAWI